MATSQTAGVGRVGRPWESPEGNLHATLLMPFDGPVADAALLSFVTCLAIADLLDRFVAPDRIALKWPNDALLDGKKLAGVLMEAGGPENDRWLAIGVGINLAHKPTEARWPPVALADVLGSDIPGPREALVTLAHCFHDRLTAHCRDGFEATRLSWLSRAARLGETVEARLPRETLSGRFDGLDDDGSLILRSASGTRRIAAADIHFAAETR